MKKKRQLCLAAVILVAAAAGIWYFAAHTVVDGRGYPRNAQQLDLRGQEITLSHYEAVRQRFPDREILWDVPFQGSTFSSDSTHLTVSTLTEADVAMLDHFQQLRVLDAQGCSDYRQLAALMERRPGLDVRYSVTIDGKSYPRDAEAVTVGQITDEVIELLTLLPRVNSIDASACTDFQQLEKLRRAYPDCDMTYFLALAGQTIPENAAELTLTGAEPREVQEKLAYLPDVRRVTLTNPVPDAESLRALPDTYPGVEFFWELEVLGVRVTSEDTQADLSGIALDSVTQVEDAMACFPGLEKVILCGCGIDNETMAAYRNRVREDYKVVWSVEVGYLTLRTDDIYFMPGKFNRGVTDEQAYNLRYCEDMLCIDVGHKAVYNCEWAAFMPKLKYLILADTPVSDISPLAGLKELVYLEIFMTRVEDYTPLLTCTALEDLNICYTYGSPEPIQKMTWLKRLWWADCPLTTEEFHRYLPDTEMMFLHHSSTGNGWRQGKNYYDMRDILGMHYMWG